MTNTQRLRPNGQIRQFHRKDAKISPQATQLWAKSDLRKVMLFLMISGMKIPLLAVLVLIPTLALADANPTTTSAATIPTTNHPTTTSPTATHPVTASPAKASPTEASSTTTGANSTIPDPTSELQVMTERLKLSPSQQSAIKPILVAEFEKRKAIEDNKSLSVQQKHDQTGTVHRAALQQIKAIFTPAQMALIVQGQDNPSPSSTNPTSTKSN